MLVLQLYRLIAYSLTVYVIIARMVQAHIAFNSYAVICFSAIGSSNILYNDLLTCLSLSLTVCMFTTNLSLDSEIRS